MVTPACNINELQSTMLVKGMSIENFQLPEVLSLNEMPVWWQVNLQHLSLPMPETKALVI